MAAVARGGKVVQGSAAAALGGGRRNRGAGDVAPGSILTFAPPSMRIWHIAAQGRQGCILTHMWSTYVLVFFSWLLDHVIYLKLLKKAEQIYKITTILT